MTNRKNIEKEIAKRLAIKVSSLGFILIDKSLNLFEHIENNAKWEFEFYLTDNKPYSLFLKVGITYLDLTAIINRLLLDTAYEKRFKSGIGMTTNDFKIIKEKSDLKISDFDNIVEVVNNLYSRVEEIRNAYWIPQSIPTEQIESFLTKPAGHWFNPILIQNVTIGIAIGILNQNSDLIRKSLEKGKLSLSERSQSYEQDKLLIQILAQKLLQKGCI